MLQEISKLIVVTSSWVKVVSRVRAAGLIKCFKMFEDILFKRACYFKYVCVGISVKYVCVGISVKYTCVIA